MFASFAITHMPKMARRVATTMTVRLVTVGAAHDAHGGAGQYVGGAHEHGVLHALSEGEGLEDDG